MRRQTLSVRESAKVLGVTEQTVRVWMGKGWLDYTQPAGKGGRVLVSRASVEALAGVSAASGGGRDE